MAPTTPVGIPAVLRAGDTWKWTQTYADYPISDSWALSYHIRGKDRIDWDSSWVTDDGTTHTIEIPSAVTALIGAGGYTWQARVTDTSETYTAAEGVLTIEPDPETAVAGDFQSHAERMVSLLEQEIEARVPGTGAAHVDYMIAGRQIRKFTLVELEATLGRYRSKVRRQRHPTQLFRHMHARFVCP